MDILVKEVKTPPVELRAVYAQVMEELIKSDKKYICLDADLMRAIGMMANWRKYPRQVFDCGIAEANMIGVAAGLSSEGYVPFVHSFCPFMSRRVFDQIFMSCAYAKQNVKIIASDPGVTAALNGGTHTANEDIAMMRAVPGITIFDVADAVQAKQALKIAAQISGVCYLRYPRGAMTPVYAENVSFEPGRAMKLRDGDSLTIIASGIMVAEALKAAEELDAMGVQARVLDSVTIAPLDRDAVLAAAKETGAIVTAENHSIYGGLGGAVAEILGESCPIPLERVGNTGSFGDVGSLSYLKEHYGLTSADIVKKAKCALTRKVTK